MLSYCADDIITNHVLYSLALGGWVSKYCVTGAWGSKIGPCALSILMLYLGLEAECWDWSNCNIC